MSKSSGGGAAVAVIATIGGLAYLWYRSSGTTTSPVASATNQPTAATTAQSNILAQIAAALNSLMQQKQQQPAPKSAAPTAGAGSGASNTAAAAKAKPPGPALPGLPGGGPFSPAFGDFMNAWQSGETLAEAAASAGISTNDAIQMVTGVNPGNPETIPSDIGGWSIDQLPSITADVASLPNTTNLGALGDFQLSDPFGGGGGGGVNLADSVDGGWSGDATEG